MSITALDGVPGAGTLCESPLLEMRNVTVTFSRVEALKNASVSIRNGEVLGLLGNGGAGKTTLVKALVGLLPIDSGEVYFEGHTAGFRSPAAARRNGIEVMYQDLALLDHLSVARNFFAGKEPLSGRRPFRRLVHRDLVRQTNEIFDELGLSELPPPDRLVSQLSGAQRQLLAVARAVHFATRVLILDEPTAALSDNQVEIVLSLIDKARAAGVAVVFVTHKAYEVFNVADEFVVLDKGKTIVASRQEETSLKQLEKLLVSSRFTMVQEMAAAVAHQIRNPLGVMRVSLEMLQEDFDVTDDRDSYDRLLKMLFDEVNTLDIVVTNYLDFARQKELRRTAVPVSDLMEDVRAMLPQETIDLSNLIVKNGQSDEIIFVDREMMNQVLVNLIINAAEASSDSQPIIVRVTDGADTTTLSVEDFGPGIDAGTRKMIFNPFFTTKSRGTGLGLSIVNRIVEQHGGSLSLHTEPGKGTRFDIRLPRHT